jgi:ribonuclease T
MPLNYPNNNLLAKRFRGFLPVVTDIETSGLNPGTNALLELASIITVFDENQQLVPAETYHYHILPFDGAKLDESSLKFTGITDPFHPLRFAISEEKMLKDLFEHIHNACQLHGCERAVLVGHNPTFDLNFLQAACERHNIKKSPFHRFTTFDTATLSALVYGQTVLAKALNKANLGYDAEQAHSALYDASQTARLFCGIVNKWKELENFMK